MALTWGPSNTWMSFTETTFAITITRVPMVPMVIKIIKVIRVIMGWGSVKHTDVAFLMVMVNKDLKIMEIIRLEKGHMDIINWKRLGSTFVLSWLKCEQIIERTKSTST